MTTALILLSIVETTTTWPLANKWAIRQPLPPEIQISPLHLRDSSVVAADSLVISDLQIRESTETAF